MTHLLAMVMLMVGEGVGGGDCWCSTVHVVNRSTHINCQFFGSTFKF